MPTTGSRAEDRLIQLLLSVYDGGSWAEPLSSRRSPECEIDGGVELVATRKSDGCVLAIEHILIEPFVGVKRDFFRHFQALQSALRADPSLKLTERADPILVDLWDNPKDAAYDKL